MLWRCKLSASSAADTFCKVWSNIFCSIILHLHVIFPALLSIFRRIVGLNYNLEYPTELHLYDKFFLPTTSNPWNVSKVGKTSHDNNTMPVKVAQYNPKPMKKMQVLRSQSCTARHQTHEENASTPKLRLHSTTPNLWRKCKYAESKVAQLWKRCEVLRS